MENTRYCVSLRDARRCIILVKWFKNTLQKRKDLPLSSFKDGQKYHKAARKFPREIRSFVLALAHCYQSRLTRAASRKNYRDKMASCIQKDNVSFDAKSFEDIVRAEQEDYLKRMELPQGTAKNAALRENVFVMLVCILNRIPVFVVGKPGCSKSFINADNQKQLEREGCKRPFSKDTAATVCRFSSRV